MIYPWSCKNRRILKLELFLQSVIKFATTSRGIKITTRPLSVNISLFFVLFNAVIWLVLGILIAINRIPGIPDILPMKIVMAIISIAFATVLLGLVFFIQRHNRLAYFLALIIFVVTCLLTFIDDVGFSDLVVLVLNIVPIFLLIKDRKWYLQANS